jgi:HEAT repeat protein
MSNEGVEEREQYDPGLAELFVKMQCPVVEYLTYKLQDENEWIRCFAADALGDITDARNIDGLVIALKDPSINVRIAATRSLWKIGKSGDRRAFAILCTS